MHYLNRLINQITRLAFAVDDPLWPAALRARDALQRLYVATHFASVKEGVVR